MSKKRKELSEEEITFEAAARRVRRDWNGVNPASRFEKDKTKYQRRKKHTPDWKNDYDEI